MESLLAQLVIPECNTVYYNHGAWVFPCGLTISDDFVATSKMSAHDTLRHVHANHHKAGHTGDWYLLETLELTDTSFKITVNCSCKV